MKAKTPREAAKELIYPYVARGDSLQWLVDGGMGWSGPSRDGVGAFRIQTGGYLWAEDGSKYKKLTAHQIGVSKIDGRDCFAIFSLDQLYQEIKGELMAGAEQLALPL